MTTKRKHCIVVLAALSLAAAAPHAHAATRYVKASAAGANNGSSWTNAYVSLQSALAVATAGDEIWVAAGEYKPTTGTARNVYFTLVDGVSVYGGFPGGAGQEGDFAVRDHRTHVTTLSANLGSPTNPNDNSYHVVVASNVTAATILDGFTITGGAGGGLVANQENRGGGLISNGGSATIRNCIFERSWALVGGGAYVSGGAPTFINCQFRGNYCFSGGNSGGAMYNDSTSVTLLGCLFVGNACGSRGGAVYHGNGTSTNINCTYTANTVGGGQGGAVWAGGGGAHVYRNCIVYGNSAAVGPELYSNGGPSITVTYSDVLGGFGGAGNINALPQFASLPSPGADGNWGTPDDSYGDLRPAAGSPCIDAGDNAQVPATLASDLDGRARKLDDPNTADTGAGAAPIVDMGAYERSAVVLGDLNCDSIINAADRDLLIEAMLNPAGFGVCDISRADMNGDSLVDAADIQRFTDLLLGS